MVTLLVQKLTFLPYMVLDVPCRSLCTSVHRNPFHATIGILPRTSYANISCSDPKPSLTQSLTPTLIHEQYHTERPMESIAILRLCLRVVDIDTWLLSSYCESLTESGSMRGPFLCPILLQKKLNPQSRASSRLCTCKQLYHIL